MNEKYRSTNWICHKYKSLKPFHCLFTFFFVRCFVREISMERKTQFLSLVAFSHCSELRCMVCTVHGCFVSNRIANNDLPFREQFVKMTKNNLHLTSSCSRSLIFMFIFSHLPTRLLLLSLLDSLPVNLLFSLCFAFNSPLFFLLCPCPLTSLLSPTSFMLYLALRPTNFLAPGHWHFLCSLFPL